MATAARKRSDRLRTVDLDLRPNEASDLAPVKDARVLRAHGWDTAFWTALDEGAVEDSVGVIGRKREGDHTWEVARPRLRPDSHAGKTEDAEVCVHHDGWVYLIGSHYGSKAGPLESSRAWIARFREAEFAHGLSEATPEVRVVKNKFRLHRALNDALRAFGPELRQIEGDVRERFIDRTRRKAGRRRAGRINPTDAPINIEGAAFLPDGSLLLGLRYPASAGGEQILAELSGIEAMLEDERAAPVVRRFWVLQGAGSPRRPTGIRALVRAGRELHAIVGSLDSEDPQSALVDADPRGSTARCSHYRFRLGSAKDGGAVETALVRRFPLKNVEGLAPDRDGRFFYVTDEDDRVHVRYMHD